MINKLMKKICFLNIKHIFKLSTYASPCKGVTIQLDIQMLFIFTTSLSKFESISFCLNFSNISFLGKVTVCKC